MVDLFGAPIEPVPSVSVEQGTQEDNSTEIYNPELLSPRTNPHLIGHGDIEKNLIERIDNNTLPHALIFHGQKGIGKSTLAFRLARSLFQQDLMQDDTLFISPDERIFRQVASKAHPDLLTIECEFDEKKGALKRTIDVEQIRKIAPFMRMTSNMEDGWRVVIVDDCDTMTLNAQNSLLKILEEPPRKALLILITHRVGALISTIRSRCQTLPLQALSKKDMLTVMSTLSFEKTEQEDLFFLDYCEGSPGRFSDIIEEGGAEHIENFLNIINLYPSFDPKMTHAFSDQCGKTGEGKIFSLLCSYLIWILKTLVTHKIRGEKLPFFIANNAGFMRLNEQLTAIEILTLHDTLDEMMKNAQKKTLDKRNTILHIFFLLQNAAL